MNDLPMQVFIQGIPKRLWWLSFADDDGFLGAAIVDAESFDLAITYCNWQGINPGGEVRGIEIPEEARAMVEPEQMNRLLSRDDMEMVRMP